MNLKPMPYADPAKNNACKRAWEEKQKLLNTPYWQRKKKRIGKRKRAKQIHELKPIYVRYLIARAAKRSGTRRKDLEAKRSELKIKRIRRLVNRSRRGLAFLIGAAKISNP